MSALTIDQAINQDCPTLIGRIIKVDEWEKCDLSYFLNVIDWLNLNFEYLVKADGTELRFFIVNQIEA